MKIRDWGIILLFYGYDFVNAQEDTVVGIGSIWSFFAFLGLMVSIISFIQRLEYFESLDRKSTEKETIIKTNIELENEIQTNKDLKNETDISNDKTKDFTKIKEENNNQIEENHELNKEDDNFPFSQYKTNELEDSSKEKEETPKESSFSHQMVEENKSQEETHTIKEDNFFNSKFDSSSLLKELDQKTNISSDDFSQQDPNLNDLSSLLNFSDDKKKKKGDENYKVFKLPKSKKKAQRIKTDEIFGSSFGQSFSSVTSDDGVEDLTIPDNIDLIKNLENHDQLSTSSNSLIQLLDQVAVKANRDPPVPAFMDIFQPDQPKQPKIFTYKWTNGSPIIRNFSVSEDINKKRRRRGSRTITMEDQNLALFPFANDQTKGLFCVFDGHAGKDCAIEVKNIFPRELENHLENIVSTDLSAVFSQTYLTVDNKISSFEYEGTTVTSVLIWQVGEERYLQAANVGDSTAFLKRRDEVICLTKDHKPTETEEKQRLVASGIEILENSTRIGGLAVSRALGDHFLKNEKLGVIAEPYVSPSFKLLDTDSLLIVATDGLWDVMSGEKAMEIIQNLDGAEAMARRLVQTALSDPKCQDNITVIVVEL